MLSKLVLPSTAVLGLGFAIFTIASGSRPPLAAQPVAAPASSPFARFIAGAGIVEPGSRSIAVASPLARCVAEVLVRVGDELPAGAALFRLEGRDLEAELALRRTSLATARARLEREQALPRSEDVPPAEARVQESLAELAEAENQLELARAVVDVGAVSREEVDRRRHESEACAARLAGARAELERLRAGAWRPDLEVARAELAGAEAAVRAIEVEIERLTVRAPIAGMVLQLNVRPGEFAPAGVAETPLVLMGSVHPLHVRVDVDENDAWRFRPGCAATGSVRGNRDIATPLVFEYAEPYVVPKRSLTGDTAERVDTRVMQVVFRFERGALPIQVGQQMDVFLDVDGAEQAPVLAEVSQ